MFALVKSKNTQGVFLIGENESIPFSGVDLIQSTISFCSATQETVSHFDMVGNQIATSLKWSTETLLTRKMINDIHNNLKTPEQHKTVILKHNYCYPKKEGEGGVMKEEMREINLDIYFSKNVEEGTVDIKLSLPILLTNNTSMDLVLSSHDSTNTKKSFVLKKGEKIGIDWVEGKNMDASYFYCIEEMSIGVMDSKDCSNIFWSKRMNIGTPPSTGTTVTCAITQKKEKLYNCFVIDAKPVEGNIFCCHVTIKNRFVVHNGSSMPLFIKQAGTSKVFRLTEQKSKDEELFAITNWYIDRSTSVKVSALSEKERASLEEKKAQRKQGAIAEEENDLKEDLSSIWSRGIVFDLDVANDNVILRTDDGMHRILSYTITETNSVVNLIFYDCPKSPFILLNKCPTALFYSCVFDKYCKKIAPDASVDFNWPNSPQKVQICLPFTDWSEDFSILETGKTVLSLPILKTKDETQTNREENICVFISVESVGNTKVVTFSVDSEKENISSSVSSLWVPQIVKLAVSSVSLSLMERRERILRELVCIHFSKIDVNVTKFHPSEKYHHLRSVMHQVDLSIESFQVDSYFEGCEFKVIFSTPPSINPFVKSKIAGALANTSPHIKYHYIEKICFEFSPIYFNIDDQLITHAQRLYELFLERSAKIPIRPKNIVTDVVERVPFFVGHLSISTISMSTTIHATIPTYIYIGTDQTPLFLNRLELKNLSCHLDTLVEELTSVYLTEAILRTPSLIGSLELLGNPTAFFSNIVSGVYELLSHSLQAARKGSASALVSGISKGTSSFFYHVSSGTLTSISDLSSALAKNIDKLSLDTSYIEKRINHRRSNMYKGFIGNLSEGLKGLGMAFFSGIVGIFGKPLEEGNKGGIRGFLKGTGMGIAGVFVKPLSGAMDLISGTSRGILNQVSILPASVQRKRETPNTLTKDTVPLYYTVFGLLDKYTEKMGENMREKNMRNLVVFNDVRLCLQLPNSPSQLVSCQLLLSKDDIVFFSPADETHFSSFTMRKVLSLGWKDINSRENKEVVLEEKVLKLFVLSFKENEKEASIFFTFDHTSSTHLFSKCFY